MISLSDAIILWQIMFLSKAPDNTLDYTKVEEQEKNGGYRPFWFNGLCEKNEYMENARIHHPIYF